MSEKIIETSNLDWSKSLQIPKHHIPDEELEYYDLNELSEDDEFQSGDDFQRYDE